MKIEEIARICHYANKAYCEAHNDDSQKPWSYAPEWQRESAIAGVKFHTTYPGNTGEGSHKFWLEEKESLGWKYGKVKSIDKKEHPCMVPYEKLPEFQKKKDILFISIVNALK